MKKQIPNGIYLILDPGADVDILCSTLSKIVSERIAAVQIWDNFRNSEDPGPLIRRIMEICAPANIPVLINNRWDLLQEASLDGIHLDEMQDDFLEKKSRVKKDFISGVTCNNDLSVLQWADANQFDYVSFCSMFPSTTAQSCELVSYETVKQARSISSIQIFLAGGIRPDNLKKLDGLPYSGIAVVSGIMNSNDPVQAVQDYQKKLKYN